MASIEPAAGEPEVTEDVDLAALAEGLADIETAAGEEGGASGNSGYGFNSSAVDVPLDSPDAIGPLGVTQLAYNAPDASNDRIRLSSIDDQPTILVENLEVDDTDLSNGNNMVMGQTEFSFGNDGPGAILINDNIDIVLPLGLEQLTSHGSPVEITSTTNNGYVGTTATGETVFTFDLDPVSGKYTFVQILPLDHPDTTDPNDAIEINLGIEAIDADGDNASANVRIVLWTMALLL